MFRQFRSIGLLGGFNEAARQVIIDFTRVLTSHLAQHVFLNETDGKCLEIGKPPSYCRYGGLKELEGQAFVYFLSIPFPSVFFCIIVDPRLGKEWIEA